MEVYIAKYSFIRGRNCIQSVTIYVGQSLFAAIESIENFKRSAGEEITDKLSFDVSIWSNGSFVRNLNKSEMSIKIIP